VSGFLMMGSRTAAVADSPWAATGLLLRLRWRMVRSRRAKSFIVLAGVIVFFGLLSCINLGYFVQIAAQSGRSETGELYAQAWITNLSSGTMGGLGALAVGGAVVVALFAPFTGSATTALVPTEDLAGVRPPRAHRYFDAMIINGISGIGVLQFLALTAVASLITLDGQRVWGMLFAWTVWAFLVMVTSTIGFLLEWVQRAYGRWQRRVFGVVGVAVLLGAVLLDPNRGQTLFGLADKYTTVLRLSVISFTWWSVVALLVMLVCMVGVVGLGVWVTGRALSLAPRRGVGVGDRTSRRLGSSSVTAVRGLLWRTLWRTRECRRPIIAILVVGIPVVSFTQMGESLEIALPMTIPLAVSLSWGVNVFGVLGRGMNWLGSQPKALSEIPRAAILFQAILSFLLLILLWTVSWLAGQADFASLRVFTISALTVAGLTTGLSALLSVLHPMRAPLTTGGGDALVPPLTALGYLGLLVGFGCVPGILLANLEDPVAQTVGVIIALVVSWIFIVAATVLWRNPRRRARVIAVVSSD